MEHWDEYEHYGSIKYFVHNLQESYARLVESNRFFLEERDADFIGEYQFEMPPMILWEWMIDINKRNLWMAGTVWSQGERIKGRTGKGATNHCAHGRENSLEVILDWKPFEYYTYQGGNKIIQLISTLKFIENEHGTKFYEIIKMKNRFPKFISKFLTRLIALKVMHVYECYKKIEKLHKQSSIETPEGLLTAG